MECNIVAERMHRCQCLFDLQLVAFCLSTLCDSTDLRVPTEGMGWWETNDDVSQCVGMLVASV